MPGLIPLVRKRRPAVVTLEMEGALGDMREHMLLRIAYLRE